LNRFSECLLAASLFNVPLLFDVLGRKCLENLETEVAIRAFQYAGNLSMVYSIESFKLETEKNILLGHVACIFGQYDLAQECFLKSSNPILALELRCDLHDWLIALNLARV
jgi:WD repeat-containing protein 19